MCKLCLQEKKNPPYVVNKFKFVGCNMNQSSRHSGAYYLILQIRSPYPPSLQICFWLLQPISQVLAHFRCHRPACISFAFHLGFHLAYIWYRFIIIAIYPTAQYLYVNAGTMSIARASVDQTPRQPREEDAGPMNVVLLSDPVYESSQDTADQIQFEVDTVFFDVYPSCLSLFLTLPLSFSLSTTHLFIFVSTVL